MERLTRSRAVGVRANAASVGVRQTAGGERSRSRTRAGEERRWDMSNPRNWTAVQLRSELEKLGIRISDTSLSRAAMLRLWNDNQNFRRSGESITDDSRPPPVMPDSNQQSSVYNSQQNAEPSTQTVPSMAAPSDRELADALEVVSRAQARASISNVNIGGLPIGTSADQANASSYARGISATGLPPTSFMQASAEYDPLTGFGTYQTPLSSGYNMATAMNAMRKTAVTSPAADSIPTMSMMSMMPPNASMSTLMPSSTGFGVPSASLPAMETVPHHLRQQIIEGKDINLALLLFPANDIRTLRHVSIPQGDFLMKSVADPRASRSLTISEFLEAFSIYTNIMSEVFPQRRQELDRYLRDIVAMHRDFQGNLFYEYHKAFSARASTALQRYNVKVDWSIRDNNIFCSVFAGHKANACRLCGSISHQSEFCSLIASDPALGHNARNVNRHDRSNSQYTITSKKPTDLQGRKRVTVDGIEICNNFNSTRGCTRPICNFAHKCLNCRGLHPSVSCPKTGESGRVQPPVASSKPKVTQPASKTSSATTAKPDQQN